MRNLSTTCGHCGTCIRRDAGSHGAVPAPTGHLERSSPGSATRRLLAAAIIAAGVLAAEGVAHAVPFALVYQEDVQLGNDTFVLSYNSLDDFNNANEASSVETANNFATGGYLAGFTYDGSQYHLVYQEDVQFGNDTFVLSYNSLDDFNNANEASSVETANNFATGGYLAGFTYDGSQYHLVYQEDVQFGNDTFVLSYNSLNDFINANAASVVETANNFATGGYLAGFAHDGSQYHLVYQEDVQFGNDTFVLSYNSLDDFINANAASVVETANNFQTGGYLAGFEGIQVADDDPTEVPAPATSMMFGLGLAGLLVCRRKYKENSRYHPVE